MSSINLWHSDLFKITYSNIPGASIEAVNTLEQFTRSINFPEYAGENDPSIAFLGFRNMQPIGHDLNRQLGILQVGIKLDEKWSNYISLFTWMQNIRYGANITTDRLKDYVCSELNVIILNNIKNPIGRFSFTKATCVGLSSVAMEYGLGSEVEFQANFEYQEILWRPEPDPCA
jgi:hypothetical protein